MNFIRRLLTSGKGRPVAIGILLWTLLINTLTELPPTWENLPWPVEKVVDAVGSPFTTGRNLLFDGYQKEHTRKQQSQPVTIVAIDEKSLQELGQWPWPRYRLAQLLDAIAVHKPAAVGLDIYMPEADQTSPDKVALGLGPEHKTLAQQLSQLPPNDARLSEALRRTPSVLSAAGFDFKAFTTTEGMRTWPVTLEGDDTLPVFVRRFDQVLASLPQLQAAASGQAVVSVDLENGVVRHIPLVMNLSDQPVSTLAIEMLRVATHSPSVNVKLSPAGVSAVEVADLSVPTLAKGDIRLHFAKHADMASRHVSATDVLSGKVDPEMLNGKLVLLGLTGAGLNDMRTTAIGETVPGIEIQAQVIESLFDGRILMRPQWLKWAESGALLFFGGLLIWYIPRPRSAFALYLRKVPQSGLWLTLGTNALIAAIGLQVFIKTAYLFDAASFFLVLGGVMGSLVSSSLADMDIRKKATQLAQQEQALQEARLAGERERRQALNTAPASAP